MGIDGGALDFPILLRPIWMRQVQNSIYRADGAYEEDQKAGGLPCRQIY